MRGKSVDTEFVAKFIQECITNDKVSPEEICEEALLKIEEIDKQLKIRLKLSDVLSFFNYKKRVLPIEPEPVSFENINKSIANIVLDVILNNGCISIEELFTKVNITDENYRKDFILSLKRMIETKVISKNSNNMLTCGSNLKAFTDYSNIDKIYESK